MTERSTLLVVDDNPALADVIATLLSDEFEVETAYTGEEALERIGPQTDAVLLDRRMPRMNGDEVVREARAQGFDGRIAMVSGVEPREDVRELGYDRFIEKDARPDAIVDAVRALLAE